VEEWNEDNLVGIGHDLEESVIRDDIWLSVKCTAARIAILSILQ
jgi:hypothetical protein